MHKLLLIALSLTCAAGLSACASTGKGVSPPPLCPEPQRPPPSLMTEPNYANRVRAILFQSAKPATPKSAGSRPPSER